jgi:hypothetical protein
LTDQVCVVVMSFDNACTRAHSVRGTLYQIGTKSSLSEEDLQQVMGLVHYRCSAASSKCQGKRGCKNQNENSSQYLGEIPNVSKIYHHVDFPSTKENKSKEVK